MRGTKLALGLVLVITMTGCASGVKRELLATRIAKEKLEEQNRTLSTQLQRTHQDLESSNQELRRLTRRMEDARQDSRRDLAEQGEKLEVCQESLSGCEARRIELESSSVGVLDRQLDECKQRLPQSFDDGFSKGQLAVLESLQVIGTSEKECFGPFCDYFYRFQVKAGRRSFFLTRVETASKESAFATTLSTIAGLAGAVATLWP